MDELIFTNPSLRFKNEIEEYKAEFSCYCERAHGAAYLSDYDDIDEWLAVSEKNSHKDTVLEGKVVSTQYLVIRKSDDRIIGMINIRHELNDSLMKIGGHIGYSVRKSERRKGYAKKMLKMALEDCKNLGINKVLITCDKDNIASASVIKANGGILKNEITEEGNIVQRYWIEL